MPNIFCSAKLKTFIKPIIDNHPTENEEQWNAHLFYLEGRKCIIFFHKETAFSFVLIDILKKEVSQLQTLFINSFIHQLYADAILEQKDEALIRTQYQNLTFLSTNNDKSAIGSINDCIQRIDCSSYPFKTTIIDAKNFIENHINITPMGAVKYNFPIDLRRETIKTSIKTEG